MPRISTAVVPSASPADLTPAQVGREFRRLLARGATLRPAGTAKRDPERLLTRAFMPRAKLELFDTRFYLAGVRQNPDLRFFVAYVVQGRSVYPRIFYKDVSLIWRSASHFISSDHERWIGKGDVVTIVEDGKEFIESVESTTDLPVELQPALEDLSRREKPRRGGERILDLVLHRGPDDRVVAYRDFTEPRRRAAADRRNLIHGGRRIAWFTRRNDPTSLRFATGFEPDFGRRGVLESAASKSVLYGGAVRRFRILSKNRRIQYLFLSGPRHTWIIPPQATTTELSSYGVRTIDVVLDDDLCLPGFEYHYIDEDQDPPVLVTQVPEGYAGEESEHEPGRVDTSAWLDRLPAVREFRRKVLRR